MNTLDNRRILLVDDMPEIHADFRKILARETATAAATLIPTDADLEADEAILFGAQTRAKRNPSLTRQPIGGLGARTALPIPDDAPASP
jgi:two-component system NtrC family sensor kinase